MIALYQFNVARMREPYDSPLWDRWRELVPVVHAQADADPAYLGRYIGEKTPAGYIQPYADDPLVMGNLSAWRTLKALHAFTFGPGTHGALMKHRARWFEPWPEGEPFTVMWWQEFDGFNLDVAKERLELLRQTGDNLQVFGWR